MSTINHHALLVSCPSSTSEHSSTWIDDISAVSCTKQPAIAMTSINHLELSGRQRLISDCGSVLFGYPLTSGLMTIYRLPLFHHHGNTQHFDGISAKKPLFATTTVVLLRENIVYLLVVHRLPILVPAVLQL
jgi:hypothetical protein